MKHVAMAIIVTLMISVALILVAGGYFAYVSLAPAVVLKRTIGTAEVKWYALHKVESEFNKTQILTSFEISNPTLLPVTITDLEATLLLNGTDYNSRTLPEMIDASINPGETEEILRYIQIEGSPISSTPGRHVFDVTMELRITGEASLLVFQEEETYGLVYNEQWILDVE